jgi:hypothetical protein
MGVKLSPLSESRAIVRAAWNDQEQPLEQTKELILSKTKKRHRRDSSPSEYAERELHNRQERERVQEAERLAARRAEVEIIR